jgi:HSP20 family protein
MRPRIHAIALTSEAVEFGAELPELFRDIARLEGGGDLTGECAPAVDVYETDHAIEITMDLPGVAAESVRIVAKGVTVLIAGEKRPRRSRGDSSFHLVERGYGRFARAVRLTTSCDTSRAQAALADGELRISLPKTAERRSRAIPIRLDGKRIAS